MINNAFYDKNAVVLCGENKIIKSVTYKIVKDLSCIISKFLLNNIKTQHDCVGILVKHNVYLPSIISSLNDSSNCFIFLNCNDQSFSYALQDLGINWILCMNDQKNVTTEFEYHDKVSLDCDTLCLLKRKHFVTTKHVFKNIFCIFQTSSTTGKPKFVKIPKYTIERNADSLRRRFNITSEDYIFYGTSLTFDPSMIELFLAINSGACLCIVEDNIKINPNKLYNALFPREAVFEYKGITVLQIVPSLFKRWSPAIQKSILETSNLRILAFGGEPFPEDIFNFNISELKIFNLYGITEVSCWATIAEVKKYEDICLGEVLSETELEIINEQGEVTHVGDGEIFIGSHSRNCYVDNEVLNETKIKFRSTGDLVTVNKNKILFKGRKNNIIKRFGIRVNLTIIEKTIQEEICLTNICIWSKDRNKLLTFILVPNENDTNAKLKIIDKLRIKLLHTLPKEYYPDFIELLSKFPLTSHGKIDRRSLIKIYELNILDKKSIEPSKMFNSLCSKYLGLNSSQLENYLNYNFFEIGGNSIVVIQLLDEFKDILETEFPTELVNLLFEKTLEECLSYIDSHILKQRKRILQTTRDCIEIIDTKKRKYNFKINIIWKYDLKACVDASPLVFKDSTGLKNYVAVGSFSHIFAVVDVENGKEICNIVLPDVIESTPLLSSCKTNLFIGCFNGVMYCINYIDCSIKWEYCTDDRIKSSPLYCRSNTAIVLGSYDKCLHCISHLDGSRLWKTNLLESINSNLLYHSDGGTIYTTTILGTCFCLSEKNGEILWRYNCTSPIFSSPIFNNPTNDSIIFSDVQGSTYCLSQDGKKKWMYQINGQIFSSVVNWENYLVCCSHDHNVYILKCDQNDANLVHKIELDSGFSSTPCIFSYSSTVLVTVASIKGTIYLINLIEGCIEAKLKLSSELFSSPVFYGNKLFIGCRGNYLNCLQIVNHH